MPAPAREAWYLPADRTNWIEVDQIAQEVTDPDWPQTAVTMRHQRRDGINPPVYESLAAAMHGKPRIDFPPAPTELIR